MRRVSLPTSLIQQQQQHIKNAADNNRSPRSRTPNSLSPKLGFLKEISEFDANLDPPFISPAASSSSSADNSYCNSPMLLSPCNQRPASARLYRRNRNGSQPIQPLSPIVGDDRIKESSNIGSQRKQSTRGTGRQSFVDGDEIDDGFRWTDVDGFYGRKNSIPLQQLLANDLALLNGIGLKNATSNADKLTPVLGNGGSPPAAYLDFDQNNGTEAGINIPSDITEDEDEDTLDAERKEKRRASGDDTIANSGGLGKSVLNDLKKTESVIEAGIPKSSPTKRRLMMISNRLYSLEEKKRGKGGGDEEEEEEVQPADQMGSKKTEAQKFLMNQARVKFMDSLDELELVSGKNGEANGIDEDVRLIRKALKARKKRDAKLASTAQQLRHFNIDQHGKMVLDSGIRTFRAKLHPGKQQSPNPQPTLAQLRNPKARRSTCPEIWLSAAEDEQRPLTKCAVRLFGCTSVGKKCIAKQLATFAEVSPMEDDIVFTESEDLQRLYRTMSFLLNEHEINMEIIQGSMLPESQDGAQFTGGELTIFAVVYSVDHRESFIRAAQILYRLYGDRREKVTKQYAQQHSKGSIKQRTAMERTCVPLILIANKSDLQRKRRVSSIEGKMLANIYKCPFVEMSALLSANVDTLWREVLRKLHKYLQARERLMLLHQKQDSVGSSESGSSPRLLARQPLAELLRGLGDLPNHVRIGFPRELWPFEINCWNQERALIDWHLQKAEIRPLKKCHGFFY